LTSTTNLPRNPFFSSLDQSFLDEIVSIATLIEIKEGDWLFKQEEEAQYIYVIIDGKISLTIMFRDHIIDKLNAYMKYEIIGWSALVKPYIYTMGAIAETDAKALQINGQLLMELMEESKDQGYILLGNLTEVIAERLINSNIQLMSIRS
jgi:CRP-like cAMP-binding protein